ncbi:hypothetical protein EOM60_04060 [Candidatus Saccharibacteria bacterium]|nr:hypothetical protein [Candidatus Saccharibacteria bacterium]
MPGFIPTDEEIAAIVRDLEINDPENANRDYARQQLIRMKLGYRDIGHVDEGLLEKQKEQFKKKPTDSKTDDISD